jgi:hypothetical protein
MQASIVSLVRMGMILFVLLSGSPMSRSAGSNHSSLSLSPLAQPDQFSVPQFLLRAVETGGKEKGDDREHAGQGPWGSMHTEGGACLPRMPRHLALRGGLEIRNTADPAAVPPTSDGSGSSAIAVPSSPFGSAPAPSLPDWRTDPLRRIVLETPALRVYAAVSGAQALVAENSGSALLQCGASRPRLSQPFHDVRLALREPSDSPVPSHPPTLTESANRRL